MGRLHVPGGCYHLIGRGLERLYIFDDTADKLNFLNRLGVNLVRAQCQCLTWAACSIRFTKDWLTAIAAVYLKSRHKPRIHWAAALLESVTKAYL